MGLIPGFFHRDKTGVETPVAVENIMGDEETPPTPRTQGHGSRADSAVSSDPRIAALEAENAAKDKRLADLEARVKQNAANAVARQVGDITTGAKAFANGLVKANRLMGSGAQAATDLHAFVHLTVAGLSTEGLDPTGAFETFTAALPSHKLTGEAVSNRTTLAEVLRLDNGANGGTEETEEQAEARIKARNDRHFAGRGIKPTAG